MSGPLEERDSVVRPWLPPGQIDRSTLANLWQERACAGPSITPHEGMLLWALVRAQGVEQVAETGTHRG